jgi:hypothetical protein
VYSLRSRIVRDILSLTAPVFDPRPSVGIEPTAQIENA